MGRATACISFLVLAGCLGSDPPPCGPLTGTYELHMVEREPADCFIFDPVVETYDGTAPSLGSSCSGSFTVSEDMCEYTYDDIVCPDPPGTVEVDGVVRQVDGPNRAEGTWNLCFYFEDGAVDCCGIYDVTVQRI